MGYRAHRYRVLFYLLLGTLAAAPLLTALSLGTNLLEMLLAFSLLVAILDAPRTRWRMVLIIAVAVAIALRVAPPSTVHERARSEEHTSELQSLRHLVCRLLLEKKKQAKP